MPSMHIYMCIHAAVRKDQTMQLASTWLELFSIILIEVSQKESDRYRMMPRIDCI